MPIAGVEDRVVSLMKQLGFTASDARAYLALLKNHPATGYELAAASGVPRSAIYNVLKRLESVGLVNAVQKKPMRYVPLSPERLVDLLGSRFSRNLDQLKGLLEGLGRRTAEVTTWTVQGYGTMLERAHELIAASRSTVFGSLWAREAERLAPAFKEALGNGVEVVLFSFTPLPSEIGQVLSYGINERDLGEYWQHKIILVSDHARVLVGGAEEIEENRAVVAEEMALVEMALSNLVLDITLYGEKLEVDVADVVSKLTIRLAPVEELLASSRDALIDERNGSSG